jgi:hypothetical protein
MNFHKTIIFTATAAIIAYRPTDTHKGDVMLHGAKVTLSHKKGYVSVAQVTLSQY